MAEAGRPDRPRLRRQQDPPARVRLRRHPGQGCRHGDRQRLHAVELVPADDGGGEKARPRHPSRAAARREGAGVAGQLPALPADGGRDRGGRSDQPRAGPAAARGEGGQAARGRPQALHRGADADREPRHGCAGICAGRSRDRRAARTAGLRAEPSLSLGCEHDAGRARARLRAHRPQAGAAQHRSHQGQTDRAWDIARIATATARRLGLDATIDPSSILSSDEYIGPRYGVVSDAAREALALVARTEGVILDPVYSSKAMAGLIDHVRQGRLTSSDTVIFVHTGGTPALFAYAEDVIVD
ncbi:MAG: pyridoxal-phosphate dependent enzyme [Rhodospirillales bacterium]|nr:pyridoxal-phosphate dependent enzyme [Rhodospirillales bacterium]